MNRRGWILFIALWLLWGMPYMRFRIAVAAIDPLVVAASRTLIGALLLLPLALQRNALAAGFSRWKWLLAYNAHRDQRAVAVVRSRRDAAEQFHRRAPDCRRAEHPLCGPDGGGCHAGRGALLCDRTHHRSPQVTDVLLGAAVLSEPLTAGMAIGFPLVIAGSVLGTSRTRAQSQLAPRQPS